jgi:acyl dehydratase
VRYYLREAQKLRARGEPVPQLGPSPGMRHMTWHSPVHAGDVLTFRTWAERKIDLPAWRAWGLLIGGSEVTNQHGEVVLSFYAQLLLERRNEARDAALA